MCLRVLVRAFLICTLASLVSCNRERRLADVLEGINRIEEHLKKEDRLREITDLVRIDATMDKLSKKFDIVIDMLDNSPSLASPRSGGGQSALMPRDLTSSLENIDSRLRSLESAVSKVDESTSKIDLYAARIEEIESRTTQMKDDTNLKLRKMSNVINALYEMNKDMKVNMEEKSETSDQTPGDSSSSFASAFIIENLEEMERKMKEQLSILASDLRSEILGLKRVVSTLGSNCESSTATEDEEWMTTRDNARSIPVKQSSRSIQTVENTLDNLVESIGRQTREIREEINSGMQEIDSKLNNLTQMTRTQQSCDPLQAAESTVETQISRVALPVQSVKEKQSGRSESCTKSVQNVPNPKSCADLRKGGATCDGIYVVFPKGVRAVRVLCDMTTDGGGWTVLMRRGDYGDKMTVFHKNWASYKNGFGDTEGEFWLGNDVIHLMTTEEENMLRIHLSSFDNDNINLDYTSFSVGNESSFYRLNIGLPTGTAARTPAANSLRYHNNHPFSTFDRKNDGFEQNCAATYKGGWWFNGCYFGFLTGEYFRANDKRETWQGIMWYDWKGNQSLKGAEMLIRPKDFTVRG